jgi:hypothetical protein
MAPLPRRLHVAVGTGLLGASLSFGCTDEDVRVNEGPAQKSSGDIQEPPRPDHTVNPGPEPQPEPPEPPKPVLQPQPLEPEPRPVNVNTQHVREPVEPLQVNEGPVPTPEPEKAPPDVKVNPGPNTPTAPTL